MPQPIGDAIASGLIWITIMSTAYFVPYYIRKGWGDGANASRRGRK